MYQKRMSQGDGLFSCVLDSGTCSFMKEENGPRLVIAKFGEEPFCFLKLSALPSFCFYPQNLLIHDKTLFQGFSLFIIFPHSCNRNKALRYSRIPRYHYSRQRIIRKCTRFHKIDASGHQRKFLEESMQRYLL